MRQHWHLMGLGCYETFLIFYDISILLSEILFIQAAFSPDIHTRKLNHRLISSSSIC